MNKTTLNQATRENDAVKRPGKHKADEAAAAINMIKIRRQYMFSLIFSLL